MSRRQGLDLHFQIAGLVAAFSPPPASPAMISCSNRSVHASYCRHRCGCADQAERTRGPVRGTQPRPRRFPATSGERHRRGFFGRRAVGHRKVHSADPRFTCTHGSSTGVCSGPVVAGPLTHSRADEIRRCRRKSACPRSRRPRHFDRESNDE